MIDPVIITDVDDADVEPLATTAEVDTVIASTAADAQVPDDEIASHRALRQRDIVPPAGLDEIVAIVIGVGAVGRAVAMQLAALGVTKVILLDDDTVDTVNLAVQAYRPDQIGLPKVHACRDDYQRMLSDSNVIAKIMRLDNAKQVEEIIDDAESLSNSRSRLAVFVCVDSMAARHSIWRILKSSADFYVEARMAAEAGEVIALDQPRVQAKWYESALFPPSQAVDLPCTAKATIYGATILAAIMVGRFTVFVRRFPAAARVEFNLFSLEMDTSYPTGQNARA